MAVCSVSYNLLLIVQCRLGLYPPRKLRLGIVNVSWMYRESSQAQSIRASSDMQDCYDRVPKNPEVSPAAVEH